MESGVPNRAKDDGTTFLDAVWEQAPFGNRGRFQSAVAHAAGEWVAAGLLSPAEKDKVVSSAARAKLS
ncbi:hypothetical protein ACQP2K_26990 [Microbispora siamensis]